MKINYANNPTLGTGKWDPLLSLLTPGGDSITVPIRFFYTIKARATYFSANGIAFFSSSEKDGVCKLWRTSKPVAREPVKTDLTRDLEKMKVGAVMEIPKSKRDSLRNSAYSLKKKGIGEYQAFSQDDKLYVKRIK